MSKFETVAWPYLEAKHYGPKRSGRVRLVVIHTPEFPETLTAAESIARYFQNPIKPSSAHITADNNSIVQSVKDSYVAYGAAGANHDGIHIELAGYAAQSRKDWLDFYSIANLAIGADAAAQYCLKYDLPPIHLTDHELQAGQSGIVGHDQVTRVYKLGDHMDPGPNFPWKRFIAMVEAFWEERRGFV